MSLFRGDTLWPVDLTPGERLRYLGVLVGLLLFLLLLLFEIATNLLHGEAEAHGGRLDASGCHRVWGEDPETHEPVVLETHCHRRVGEFRVGEDRLREPEPEDVSSPAERRLAPEPRR